MTHNINGRNFHVPAIYVIPITVSNFFKDIKYRICYISRLRNIQYRSYKHHKTTKSISILKKSMPIFANSKKSITFASQLRKTVAQMAESVDALVSNTSGVKSIPVRPRVWVQ